MLSDRQQICLERMGVVRYVSRPVCQYWFVCREYMTKEKRVLLAKIAAALHWSWEAIDVLHTFESMDWLPMPKKIVVFGENAQTVMPKRFAVPMIFVPSLEEMQRDPAAKRLAWSRMQTI